MKKLFLPAVLTTAISVGSYLGFSVNNSSDQLSDVMMANVEALANDEILDCSYTPVGFECTVTVSAEVAARLFGIKTVDGQGLAQVTIAGAQECKSGGDMTCMPVRCIEIYAMINNYNGSK